MATSFLLRKSLTIPGAITVTGNTLGLTDKNYPYIFTGPGALLATTFTYIGNDLGTFITTDTSKIVSGYPAGTTNNWGENSSMAVLKLPQGAVVKYAELIWGGSTRGNGSNTTARVNLDGQINSPVRFKVPGGRIYTIAPDPSTAAIATVGHVVANIAGINFPYTGGDEVYYVRSQDVTDIVRQLGAGEYECGGVVANHIPFAPGFTRTCGWNLIVMYELPTLPLRNLTFFLGIDAVGSDGVASVSYSNGGGEVGIIPGEIKGPRDINITGFVTPEAGVVDARVLLSGMEGDPIFGSNRLGQGDRVFFGPNASALTELQGPNNRIGNFLAAQINGDDGNLDTTGTFGNLNQNPIGGITGDIKRNTWDITNLNGRGILPNSQRNAIVRIQSQTDEYALHMLALQIDINAPNIILTKSVDKENANIGDQITYTVKVENKGSTTATNVVFKDSIPNDTTFILGSVTVDGTPNTTAIPNPPGFSIKNIPPNGVVTVTFKVTVDRLPKPNPILNQASVDFKYKPAPDLPESSGSSNSNIVNTLVEEIPTPSIESIKSVDKTSAVVGDKILYTVDLVNNGNTQLNNVIFKDTTPNGTSFVQGSLTVNNVLVNGSPQTGVDLAQLSVGERVTIKWNVQIDTLPVPNPIPNIGYTDFTYANKTGTQVPGRETTNVVITNVANATPGLQVIKAVDKKEAAVGETLTYTTTFKNTGNIDLINVVFKDTLPSSVSLIPNTTQVDGRTVTQNVQTGINIGTVPIGNVVLVEFKVKIDTVPNPNPILNTSEVIFNFIPAPGQSPLEGSVISNIVDTTVFQGINPKLELKKETSLNEANIGDEIIYTIGVKNTGNVDLFNILIKDTIPNGTSFVQGSLQLNFSPIVNGNIETGVPINILPQDGLAIITFKVKVTEVPIPNPIPNIASGTFNYIDVNGNTIPDKTISNKVETVVKIPKAEGKIEKTNDKVKAIIGEEITYSVRIQNTGSVDFNEAIFKDTIPNGTSFVQGSVTVNGIANVNANPENGIQLLTIPVGQSIVVQFRVKINTLPNPNPIPNSANLAFKYTTNNSNPNSNNGVLNSNTVFTEVVDVKLDISKEVDKVDANVGDEITYTIVAKNRTSVDIENTVIKDTIPNGTEFIQNTVAVDGVLRSGSPQDGINIGTVGANLQKTITFKVKITTVPNPNPIPNIAVANYEFRPDKTGPAKNGGDTSNIVNTKVMTPQTGSMTIEKIVDKTEALVSDVLTYISVIKNTGSLPLTNVVFTDNLEASNVTFNQGSVTVNGVLNSGNPVVGINVPTIQVSETVTVIFKVTINSLPSPNPIPNISKADYTYTPQGGMPTNGSSSSNKVQTVVKDPGTASVTIDKAVDKVEAIVSDILTYTSVIKNTGTLALTNVIFTDALEASNVTFNQGSVTVNGGPVLGNPSSGINIGNIPVGGQAIVAFKVTVNSIPSPNPIPNVSRVDYTYTPQGGSPTTGDKTSNKVETIVRESGVGNASIEKAVDKIEAIPSDVLTYTSVIKNIGNLPLTNVVFKDALEASNVTFNPGSVTINGQQTVGDPINGINILNIPVGGQAIVVFKVTVNGIPIPNPIPNTSKVDYIYTLSNGVSVAKSNTSNKVETLVKNPGIGDLSIVKEVDKTLVNLGEEINYTIRVTNTGSLPLTNVTIKDGIEATNVSIVQGSILVNGITNAGSIESGINIGNLAIGQIAIISYKVRVNGVPTPNPIPNSANAQYIYTPQGGTPTNGSKDSNKVNTTVQTQGGIANADIQKIVDKTIAKVGDELNYTIIIRNAGDLPLSNLIFTDTIEASNVSFIQGSLAINGVVSSLNPSSGVQIGNLAVGAQSVVSYKVKVDGMVVPNPIPNIAKVDYNYVPIGGSLTKGSNISNKVETLINKIDETGKANIQKSADKTIANVGDLITYTSRISNDGDVPLNNVIFKDPILSTNVTYIQGSLTVDGNQNLGNPLTGVNIGTLQVNQVAVVKYVVKINQIPVPNPIPNTSKVDYTYTPIGGNTTNGTDNSNPVNVNVGDIGKNAKVTVIKSVDKTIANINDILNYNLIVTNTGSIPLTNVKVTDGIEATGVSFILNSVTVNGVPSVEDIRNEVTIGNLSVGAVALISYRVRVDKIPTPNPIPNSAVVNYTYTDIGGSKNGTNNSNEVTTQVIGVPIKPITEVLKEVDKNVADIGDILTYTIKATNTGTVTSNNLIITDIPPQDTTFIQNTVTVNGINRGGDNPSNGVNVGNLSSGQTVILTYKVKLVEGRLPSPNPVLNTGNLSYNYVKEGTTTQITENLTTNTVSTKVNGAIINNQNSPNPGVIKSVDKAIAKVNDTLTYTLKVTNSGNIGTDTTILKDTIPKGASFVQGSVTVDGISRLNDNPETGINLGQIPAGGTKIVTFKVVVNSVINDIENVGRVIYTYKPDPNSPNTVTKEAGSNIVVTNGNTPPIDKNTGIIKAVDKEFAKVSDILNYTVTVKNTGKVAALNPIFRDNAPNGTEFVLGSVTVNGSQRPNDSIQTGVNLPNIEPNGTVLIGFKLKVLAIPNPNPLVNKGSLDYAYIIDSTKPPVNETVTSNEVLTKVNEAIISSEDGGIIKTVDKTFAKVSEELIYTVTLRNTGNVSANNIVLKDIIPSGTSFVNSSVTINGVPSASSNPENGVLVGTLEAGAVAIVTFKVMVKEIPSINPIPNKADVTYKYTVNPNNPNGESKTNGSNTVYTKINQAIIDENKGDLVKSVDKDFVSVNDVVNYTVKIRNSGNVRADNVIFKDTLPNGTTYITNSFTVDGGIIPGANLLNGVNIGSINSGSYKTIQFKVLVVSMPNPNPMKNQAIVEYEFIKNPETGEIGKGKEASNEVLTKVNEAIINPEKGDIVKSRDKEFAKVSEEITYTVRVKNSGNIDALNVVFYDTIPEGTEFVSNSLFVNGIARLNESPENGVSIGTLRPNEGASIVFKVKVIKIPSINPIPNEAIIDYRYVQNPSTGDFVEKEALSNKVYTKVNEAILSGVAGGIEKSADKDFAKISDEINYTVTLRNKGNVDATNVVLKDTIPQGVDFVLGSVLVNGVSKPSDNPQAGIGIGVIKPNEAVIVQFKVKVTSIPVGNKVINEASVDFKYTKNPSTPNGESGKETSNKVQTVINSANIGENGGGLLKEVDKAFADVSDILTYTINLRNTGNVNADNVIMIDTVPEGTRFVEGSVTVNGQGILGVSPEGGIQVGTIAPNGSVRIQYKAKIFEMPKENPIKNTANVTYSFVVNPKEPTKQTVTNTSNTVLTKVNSPNINVENGSVKKAVDKMFASVNDEITYTITVSNKGNVPATNVVIKDTIKEGTEFIQNSVVVNGTIQLGKNPELGVSVSDILEGNTTVLSYRVKVVKIPNTNPIPNNADISYSFTKDPNRPNGERKDVTTNTVYTKVNSASIDSIDGGIIKNVDKQYADVNDIITYTVSLTNKGNVDANNVIFYDTIPKGTEFVDKSLRVNGIDKSGNVQSGIQLGSIAPKETVIVSFKVRVTEMVSPNIVKNIASVGYTFTKDPSKPNGENVRNNSNEVKTVINSANISNEDGGLLKSVNKDFAEISDELVYIINLKNTGNIAAENVKFIDTIPNGTEFVKGSVLVNGVSRGSDNPENGIDIGFIPVDGKAIIQFKVKVISIPNPNPIPNKGNVSYRYLVDPISGKYNSKENKSNTVLTKVNTASITEENGGIIKKANKEYADVNDIITYTISLTNKGNVDALNILLKDTIPEGTAFIDNSVTINGVLESGVNPQNGVRISKIAPNETKDVSFKVRVIEVLNKNVVKNSANLGYSFIVDPTSQESIEKNVNSNIVTTTINTGEISQGKGGLLKETNKEFASIGEEITYTIRVKNTGNVDVTNVIIQDTVPEGTVFISGSILVNGMQRAGDNLTTGVSIGKLTPGEEQVISYRVRVNTIPKINPIENSAKVAYNYTVDPNKPNGVYKETISNTVYTKVNFADISLNTGGLLKAVDKEFTDIKEELTYTITLTNKGNTSANNIVLKDTIPEGTEFIKNSVFINNNLVFGGDPELGINVGILEPNKKSIITFKVNVISIPKDNTIENKAVINYTYTKDPKNPNGIAKEEISNEVKTVLRTGIITPGTIPIDPNTGKPVIGPDGKPVGPTGGFIKTANKEYAIIGDTITYTFKIENTGNVEVLNVIVKDIIPTGMEFVEGSISVDGVIKANENPTNGVNIGSIGAKSYKTLSFKALVKKIPESNPVKNKGRLTYEYIVDKNKPPVTKESESNIAQVTINGALIKPEDGGLIKQVDKEFAELNDELTYTIILKNTGNVKANNVVLKDTIPEGTKFIVGSLILNGEKEETLNPQTGIGILVLDKGQTAVVSYKVLVVKLNEDFKIKNDAIVSYDFSLSPSGDTVSETSISNTVVTKENSVDFTGENFKKIIDTKYASLNETVTYTFVIKNTGNIIATNVVFKDTLPKEVEFIENTVEIKGVKISSANPEKGISLGSIGVNETYTVAFKVLVISIPKDGKIDNIGILSYASQVNPNKDPVIKIIQSNKEELIIKDAIINVVKEPSVKEAVVDDIIEYIIKVSNSGNTDAINVNVSDSLSEYLQFIEGSIKIDEKECKDCNIVSGVSISKIEPNKVAIIKFKAKIIGKSENSDIINKAKVSYSYISDKNKPPRGDTKESNESKVLVEEANIVVSKTSDINFAKIEDIITYTVKVKNEGTLEVLNVIFFDTISDGTDYVEGSFTVNGTKINSIDLKKGINLGNIVVNEEKIIKYSVQVRKISCNRKIKNSAYAKFNYKISNKSSLKDKVSNVAKNIVIGQSPSFRQMNVDGIVKLDCRMPPIEEVNEVKAEVEILNYYVIDTMRGKSPENTKLTGQKLVVNGYIHETIEYTAAEETQAAHFTCRTKKFSTFVVIQEESTLGAAIKADALIEDVSYRQVGCREVYTNITFNLEAIINS